MNFENMNIWCWLIPALCGIICGILGYLIGKSNTTTVDNSAELKGLRDSNAKLKSDLDLCNKKVTALNVKPQKPVAKIDTPKGSSSAASTASSFAAGAVAGAASKTESVKAFDAAGAKAIFGKTIKQDDLKLVEGIGPKIEGMFKDSGVKTWKALSESSVADCQKVLDKGGKRYQIHDPASWPMQAKMCYEGKWEALRKWQEEHKHGKL